MRSLLIVLLILASATVLAGVLFKVQRWPGGDLLLGAGMLTELVCSVLLVLHFWKGRKKA